MNYPIMKPSMIVVACLMTISQFSCCKDDKGKDPITYEFWLGKAKDYVYFKHGTWWVYKNMSSGKLDTVSITLSQFDTFELHGTQDYSRHITIRQESLSIQTKSKRYGNFYGWKSIPFQPDATPLRQDFGIDRTKTPGKITYAAFKYPFKRDNITQQLSYSMQVAVDTTITLGNGNTYSQVQMFRLNTEDTFPDLLIEDETYNPFYTEVYYAPNVGIIKYTEPLQNRSIELVEANIIQ